MGKENNCREEEENYIDPKEFYKYSYNFLYLQVKISTYSMRGSYPKNEVPDTIENSDLESSKPSPP